MLCLDGLVVLISMGVSWAVHAGLRGVPVLQARLRLRTPPSFDQYALLLYLALPMFLMLIVFFGMHRSVERIFSRVELVVGLLKVHFALLTGIALVLFATQSIINRSILSFFLVCTFVLQYAERRALGRWQGFQHRTGQARQRLLLVGAPSGNLRQFVEQSTLEPYPPELVGRLGDADASDVSVPHKGPLADLDRVLHEEAVDHVLFFPPYDRPSAVAGPLRVCEALGIPAGLAVDMSPQSTARPRIELIYGQPFVDFELAPRPHGPLALKHVTDVVAAACGLVVLAPLLLVVALLVLITMGRPVLFVQERAGRRGRRFRMLKFRTMIAGAETKQETLQADNIMGGPVFKMRSDPRVTPLGRLLRSSSIDELPQLFNVLVGQMSLVGPRPLPIQEQERIRGWHRRRLSMKPGITGLWQVSGRSDIGFEQWMRLDLEYIDSWSPGLDLRILLKTIPALLRRRGAI